VRRSIDDGLRRGHEIRVTHHGALHRVRTDDEAVRWAAVVANEPDATRQTVPFWRRPLRLIAAETATSVPAPARWATALAAWFSLITLMVALSGSAVFVTAVSVGLAGGALVSSRLGDHRPRALQIAVAGVIVVALGFITVDARDVDGLLAALRGPLPNLLVLLVVLHGFEVVDRRTLRVHQAITFVAMAYAAGLRIDDALGWWIAGWATALVASLLLTSLQPRLATPTAGVLGRATVWTAGAVAATLALLSIVPIPDGPARLGLPSLSTNGVPIDTPGALAAPGGTAIPAETGRDRGRIGPVVGYPGFTDTLDTTIRGDLGDEVVMRVRAPAPAFWRGQTFSEFDGRRWTVSPATGRRVDGPVIDVAPAIGDLSADDVRTEEFIQTYFVETDLPNVVFAAARPTQVVIDGDLWTRPDGALRSDRDPDAGVGVHGRLGAAAGDRDGAARAGRPRRVLSRRSGA
jgi:protein-glutamine gamma-glutamyltransferase